MRSVRLLLEFCNWFQTWRNNFTIVTRKSVLPFKSCCFLFLKLFFIHLIFEILIRRISKYSVISKDLYIQLIKKNASVSLNSILLISWETNFLTTLFRLIQLYTAFSLLNMECALKTLWRLAQFYTQKKASTIIYFILKPWLDTS